VFRKRLYRDEFLCSLREISPCKVVMEACGGANHERELAAIFTVQTAGEALNHNPHLHGLLADGYWKDGVFTRLTEVDLKILIRLLAERPQQTAKALSARILKKGRRCSIQGVYHELRKLQRDGSVVKMGTSFSLSFLWIENLADIAYQIQRNYVQNLAAILELPLPGETKRWKFHDILRMDAMYVQLTLALRRQVRDGATYEWCPAAWFTLVQEEIEKQFKAATHASHRDLYVILGGTSDIEWEWVKTRVSPLIYYAPAGRAFWGQGHIYVTTIGPYVLKPVISRELAVKLRRILNDSVTVAEGSVSLRRLLMSRRWPCSVTVEYSEQKATQLKRRYRRFFADKSTSSGGRI
jgi:hypothetical protein